MNENEKEKLVDSVHQLGINSLHYSGLNALVFAHQVIKIINGTHTWKYFYEKEKQEYRESQLKEQESIL
jgi:hypothetical protein